MKCLTMLVFLHIIIFSKEQTIRLCSNINAFCEEEIKMISEDQCIFDKSLFSKDTFLVSNSEGNFDTFISYVKTSSMLTVNFENEVNEKWLFTEEPGIFALVDIHSNKFNICILEGRNGLSAEMRFMMLAIEFLKTLDDSFLIKKKPLFYLYTIKSPSLVTFESYGLISKMFPEYTLKIMFADIRKNLDTSYLYESNHIEQSNTENNHYDLLQLKESFFYDKYKEKAEKFSNLIEQLMKMSPEEVKQDEEKHYNKQKKNNKNKNKQNTISPEKFNESSTNTLKGQIKSVFREITETIGKEYNEMFTQNTGKLNYYLPNISFESFQIKQLFEVQNPYEKLPFLYKNIIFNENSYSSYNVYEALMKPNKKK